MILIVDANALVTDAELNGQQWAAIQEAVQSGAMNVIIPEIVAAEVTATVRRNRRELAPKTRRARRAPDVERKLREARDAVHSWADQYDAAVIARNAGFTIDPAPTTSHAEVAQRAIDRVPPFNEHGGGYRDTLHWLSVLTVARARPTADIVFLTNDDGYWANGDLKQQLRDEHELLNGAGTLTLIRKVVDLDVPGRFDDDWHDVPEADVPVDAILSSLFSDGALETDDLWVQLGQTEPLAAVVSNPTKVDVVWAQARSLVAGGTMWKAALELTATVELDWVDWEDGGKEQRLIITGDYTTDTAGQVIDAADIEIGLNTIELQHSYGNVLSSLDWSGLSSALADGLTTPASVREGLQEQTARLGREIGAALQPSVTAQYRALGQNMQRSVAGWFADNPVFRRNIVSVLQHAANMTPTERKLQNLFDGTETGNRQAALPDGLFGRLRTLQDGTATSETDLGATADDTSSNEDDDSSVTGTGTGIGAGDGDADSTDIGAN